MDEQEHLQRVALEESNVVFVNKLDVNAILPHLIAHHLLTPEDRQVLMTYAKTQVEKAQYLSDILPRKSKGWFELFLECLRESSIGTGHGDLVEDLETKLQELIQQNNTKKGKKKVLKLGGKPSSAEKPQQPVGGGQTDDVSDIHQLGKYFVFILLQNVCLSRLLLTMLNIYLAEKLCACMHVY